MLGVHGVLIAIGHSSNTGLFDSELDMRDGCITVKTGLNGGATSTSNPDVFAAGDATDQVYRQATTSAGFSCIATLDAERFLDELYVYSSS